MHHPCSLRNPACFDEQSPVIGRIVQFDAVNDVADDKSTWREGWNYEVRRTEWFGTVYGVWVDAANFADNEKTIFSEFWRKKKV